MSMDPNKRFVERAFKISILRRAGKIKLPTRGGKINQNILARLQINSDAIRGGVKM